MVTCLHLPVDFERREAVRLFARKLGEINQGFADMAPLYAVRMWLDWATNGRQFRKLANTIEDDPRLHDWKSENLTYVLEDAARWTGNDGALVTSAIQAGFLAVVNCEAVGTALVIDGFWQFNEHFDPDYRTMQQRGAAAQAERRALEKLNTQASERRKIFAQQGYLPFGSEEVTESEQDAAIALFMRLHRECGLDLPKPEEFTEHPMRDALNVIRKFTPEEITKVEQWILDHAEDVDFVKSPARILETFMTHVQRAKE